ncbi:biopolymer transporter ExbD [bacterium]|nr:MAG: biopolymer transporter ExbD [bacterium]RKZ25391.1 MAG: biopolymer transporter ExbD [bacterium]
MELRKRIQREAEIPTASMADIAFLLIIFFMVSTVFSNEMGLQIILPEKGGVVKVKSKNIAKVYIDKDGSVRINGEPVRLGDIANLARQMLAENDKLIFSIKTNPDAKYDYLIRVFDQLRLANAERISFAPSGGK